MSNYTPSSKGTELPTEEGREVGLDFHMRSGDNIVPYAEFQRKQAERAARLEVENAIKPELTPPTDIEVISITSGMAAQNRRDEVALYEKVA